MTSGEVQQLARRIASAQASLNAIARSLEQRQAAQDDRMARIEDQVRQLSRGVATLCGKRSEWERGQNTGARSQAAVIGAAAAIASAVVSTAVQVLAG